MSEALLTDQGQSVLLEGLRPTTAKQLGFGRRDEVLGLQEAALGGAGAEHLAFLGSVYEVFGGTTGISRILTRGRGFYEGIKITKPIIFQEIGVIIKI